MNKNFLITGFIILVTGGAFYGGMLLEDKGKESKELKLQKDEDKKRSSLEFAKKQARDHIQELVVVKCGTYQTKAFGGITGLQVILNNNSGFKLDAVYVELSYFKSKGSLCRTQPLTFYDVSPRKEMMLWAPDVSCGKTVGCKIMSIKSQELDL